MKHIMLDLETMSTASNAAIYQARCVSKAWQELTE